MEQIEFNESSHEISSDNYMPIKFLQQIENSECIKVTEEQCSLWHDLQTLTCGLPRLCISAE